MISIYLKNIERKVGSEYQFTGLSGYLKTESF